MVVTELLHYGTRVSTFSMPWICTGLITDRIMTIYTNLSIVALSGAVALASVPSAEAGEYGKSVINDKAPAAGASWCDLFKKNKIYQGGGFINSVKFKGRYHGQWISQKEDTLSSGVNSPNGYHEYQSRRFRLGTEIEMSGDLTLTASINVSDGSGGAGSHGLAYGVFFDDWDELNLVWKPSDEFYVLLGKAKQKITVENEMSSNNILTIERSAITSAVISNKPWGVAVGFEALGLSHEVGGWVTGADRDSTGERYDWAGFDSRGSLTYRNSFDLSEDTKVQFGYQFTNNSDGSVSPHARADENLGSAFEHVVSLGTVSEFGRFGLITDVIYAANGLATGALPAGYDTAGVVIMPYYNITDDLQFVTRYAYMGEGREQRPQRYDARQTVEGYHTFYAGLNYYLCRNNLKLMAGYEYASGDLYGSASDTVDTGTWMLGVRTSW